jgi:hypothetical protein
MYRHAGHCDVAQALVPDRLVPAQSWPIRTVSGKGAARRQALELQRLGCWSCSAGLRRPLPRCRPPPCRHLSTTVLSRRSRSTIRRPCRPSPSDLSSTKSHPGAADGTGRPRADLVVAAQRLGIGRGAGQSRVVLRARDHVDARGGRESHGGTLERWLMLRSWRLWDARLFAIDADSGEVLASFETGQRVPMAERAIQTPEATFPLGLDPRQRVLLVLRIQDKSFAVVGAYLVDPDHQDTTRAAPARPFGRAARVPGGDRPDPARAQASGATPRSRPG